MQPLPVLHHWLTGKLSITVKGIKMIKFCQKCQCETERNNKRGTCKQCSSARSSAWYQANRERAKAYGAAWYIENIERIKLSSANWNAKNPERKKSNNDSWAKANQDRIKATNAAWRAENVERRKANGAAWYAANRERANSVNAAWYACNTDKAKANNAAWHKANPEAKRIYRQNREARKRTNGGTLSKGLSAKLFKLQKGKCPCCKQPLGVKFHLDHIVPIALGGSNTDDNIQLLRAFCNIQKHAKNPIDFMQSKGFLL